MFAKSSFYRAVAIPSCVAWAVVELIALQRARRQRLRNPS